MKNAFLAAVMMITIPFTALTQDLTPQWEKLTASEWEEAMVQSDSTCILPLGILEKHGPHLPMGSDIIVAREIALAAAKQEYAVVFPEFYFGQIYEAKHLGGTFALSSELVWNLLKETVDEIGRNGFKKIILINGHGGNNNLLPYFVQTQLEEQKNYVTYLYSHEADDAYRQRLNELRNSDPSTDMHAGERETSILMHLRPELVKMESTSGESGADRARLNLPESLYTGIWWYARFPGHYAGKGEAGSEELGEFIFNEQATSLSEAIRQVKNDGRTLAIQKEYFEQVDSLGQEHR